MQKGGRFFSLSLSRWEMQDRATYVHAVVVVVVVEYRKFARDGSRWIILSVFATTRLYVYSNLRSVTVGVATRPSEYNVFVAAKCTQIPRQSPVVNSVIFPIQSAAFEELLFLRRFERFFEIKFAHEIFPLPPCPVQFASAWIFPVILLLSCHESADVNASRAQLLL